VHDRVRGIAELRMLAWGVAVEQWGMAHRAFTGVKDDDPDVLAFLQALDEAHDADPLPVDLDEVWTLRFGSCLYLDVPVPTLQRLPDLRWAATELEVLFRPASSPSDRGVEASWAQSDHPMDAQVSVERGQLTVSVPDLPVQEYVNIVLHWLRYQLGRPLERQSWAGSSGYSIVLADTRDVIASGGRKRWLRRPDVIERFVQP
jgi:hypothetical protein